MEPCYELVLATITELAKPPAEGLDGSQELILGLFTPAGTWCLRSCTPGDGAELLGFARATEHNLGVAKTLRQSALRNLGGQKVLAAYAASQGVLHLCVGASYSGTSNPEAPNSPGRGKAEQQWWHPHFAKLRGLRLQFFAGQDASSVTSSAAGGAVVEAEVVLGSGVRLAVQQGAAGDHEEEEEEPEEDLLLRQAEYKRLEMIAAVSKLPPGSPGQRAVLRDMEAEYDAVLGRREDEKGGGHREKEERERKQNDARLLIEQADRLRAVGITHMSFPDVTLDMDRTVDATITTEAEVGELAHQRRSTLRKKRKKKKRWAFQILEPGGGDAGYRIGGRDGSGGIVAQQTQPRVWEVQCHSEEQLGSWVLALRYNLSLALSNAVPPHTVPSPMTRPWSQLAQSPAQSMWSTSDQSINQSINQSPRGQSQVRSQVRSQGAVPTSVPRAKPSSQSFAAGEVPLASSPLQHKVATEAEKAARLSAQLASARLEELAAAERMKREMQDAADAAAETEAAAEFMRNRVQRALLAHYVGTYTDGIRKGHYPRGYPLPSTAEKDQAQASQMALGKSTAIMREYKGKEGEVMKRLGLFVDTEVTSTTMRALAKLPMVQHYLQHEGREDDEDEDEAEQENEKERQAKEAKKMQEWERQREWESRLKPKGGSGAHGIENVDGIEKVDPAAEDAFLKFQQRMALQRQDGQGQSPLTPELTPELTPTPLTPTPLTPIPLTPTPAAPAPAFALAAAPIPARPGQSERGVMSGTMSGTMSGMAPSPKKSMGAWVVDDVRVVDDVPGSGVQTSMSSDVDTAVVTARVQAQPMAIKPIAIERMEDAPANEAMEGMLHAMSARLHATEAENARLSAQLEQHAAQSPNRQQTTSSRYN
jgi:hypothetical protein